MAVANVVRPRAHGAIDLAATCLDCAKEHVSKNCVLPVAYVQLAVSYLSRQVSYIADYVPS